MTKASLRVWINWDPDGTGIGANLPGPNVMEVDINVAEGDEPVGITISDQGVSMTSQHEPRLVTVPEPIHPEASVGENVAHVLRALRDGAAMTRANSAFIDLLRHFGIKETRFATDDLDGFMEADDSTEWITNERKP